MSFQIQGLDPTAFAHLFGLPEPELATLGVERHAVRDRPGYPDRVELRDLDPGENALLLNYLHQPADNPYRASHAIYIREGSTAPARFVDAVPPALAVRPLSLRAFNRRDRLIDAELLDGRDLPAAVERLFANRAVAYLHAHYARMGCFAARVDRI